MTVGVLGRSDAEPPDSDELARWTVEATLIAPRSLRHELLEQWGDLAGPVTMGRVALALTELVTNAVQHGQDSITVVLGRTPTGLLIQVSEHPPPLDRPQAGVNAWRQSSPDADPGGRGLRIVAAVSTRSGRLRRGATSTVWAEVPVHSAAMGAPAAT